jgi:AraC-like DNA-binding protein
MNQRDEVPAISAAARLPTDNDMIASGRDMMAPWQARCIQAYIALNLHAKIRVLDLVRVVRFAPNRFDRVFKKTFDCSPHQYVMRMRIARAQRLLLESDDTLSKIAATCGLGSQSHLSNLFRKMMAQSPGKWRRNHPTSTSRQFGAHEGSPTHAHSTENDEQGETSQSERAMEVEML